MNLKNTTRWVVLMGLGLLSACANMQHQSQIVAQRTLCRAQCAQHYQYCKQICDENEQLCLAKRDARADIDFARYQAQQQVKGQIVMEELPSFRDPLACLKPPCECEQDKDMCQQACRGSIHKRLQFAMQLN